MEGIIRVRARLKSLTYKNDKDREQDERELESERVGTEKLARTTVYLTMDSMNKLADRLARDSLAEKKGLPGIEKVTFDKLRDLQEEIKEWCRFQESPGPQPSEWAKYDENDEQELLKGHVKCSQCAKSDTT